MKLLVDIFLKNHCFQHNYIFILSLSSKEPIAYIDSKQHNGIKNPRVNRVSPMTFHNANCWWLFILKYFMPIFDQIVPKGTEKEIEVRFFFLDQIQQSFVILHWLFYIVSNYNVYLLATDEN